MSDLHRLVYTSFRKPNCDDGEIKNILKACERNNPKRDVTGLLMHSDSRFIQYIEGKQKDLKELYELIKEDDRHGGVNLRNMEPIKERSFPSWQMAYKDISQSLDFHTKVSSEDKEKFEALLNAQMDFTDEGMKLIKLFFKMA